MPDIDMRIFSRVVREWETAAHGHKGAVLAKRLPLLGMSLGTFHREVQKQFGGDGRQFKLSREERRKRPEYVEAVKEIMVQKYHPKKGVRSLTTADAQVEAALAGCPLAAAIPEGTVNRLARELGLTPQVQRKEARFEASRPNELHQMDASRSEYFQCHRHRGGEWIIKLSPILFKNRDYREHRERVWIWQLVDDHSGYRVMRYCVAKGENAEDGIDFLQWAWSKTEEHAPFRGLPETLYMDQGPLNKTKAFQHFCADVAGVKIKAHEAGRPQATGKVESGWKDLWRRFEARFFREPGWEGREFSLAEMNQELCWYLKEHHNRRDHRRLKLTKEEAWLTVKGVVDIDPGAWAHIFHREFRTLDAGGCFDFRGDPFKVQGIPYPGGVRVEVYLGVRDGAVLVMDPRDGQKYPAGPFEIPPAGEYHRGAETPLEELQKEHKIRTAGATGDAWGTGATRVPVTFRPEDDGKVVHLVRQAEVRESGFEMPAGVPGRDAQATMEDLAQGVELIDRLIDQPIDQERLFATPWDRYKFLLVQQAQGQPLAADEQSFLAWFEGEYQEMLAITGAGLGQGARLAVVE